MKNIYTPNHVWIWVLLFLGTHEILAQERTLSGTVRSDTNEPLPGVNVVVRGSSIGTITDASGKYSLDFPGQDAVLSFSFIGYTPEERKVDGQTTIDVILYPSIQSLQEVVVVGYGTQKKSDLTGAIATVKASELKQMPILSLDQGLQGRVAGVQITQGTGAPGSAVSVRIRGGNSLNGSNEPLYVIDGFPVSGSVGAYSARGGAGYGNAAGNTPNPLATLNPNDIESIEVLKDASATAIYGSRGANGVVLITTKRGKAGETKVDFESYYGWQRVAKKLDLLNASEFATLENEVFKPAIYADPGSLGEGTDWQDEIFETAPIQNHQFTVSGGDEKTTFSVAGSYFDQQGIIIESGFKRGSLRFNLDNNIGKKLKIGTNVTVSRSVQNQVPAAGAFETINGLITSVLFAPPTIPVYNELGDLTLFGDFNPRYNDYLNPVAIAREVLNTNTTNRMIGSLYAEYEIVKGLKYRFVVGSDVINDRRDSYVTRNVRYGQTAGGLGGVGYLENITPLHESILTYMRDIGSHTIHLTGVYSTQSQTVKTDNISSQGFPSDALENNSLDLANTSVVGGDKTKWRLDSWTIRANYSFKSKYLLTLAGRADGSTRFGSDNKWGYFPSVAVAWRFVEEEFMKSVPVVSDAKVRFSYGLTGNAEIPLYRSQTTLGTNGGFNYNFNNSRAVGIAPLNLGNSELKWENTASLDVGIDLGLFNNRLSLTADYYLKTTRDLIIQRAVGPSSGFSSYLGNFGTVENKGVELGVTAQVVDAAFRWSLNGNISVNRNELLRIDGTLNEIVPTDNGGVGQFGIGSILRVGEPVGSFFGYIWDGVWQEGDDIANSHMKTATPGNARYVDLNMDGALNDNDRTVIGDPNPDFIFGLNNNLSYKNFDLSLFVQGVYGNDILNQQRILLETAGGTRNNLAVVLNRWTPENRSNEYVKAGEAQRLFQSTNFVEDGSFIRLRNVTLGYTLPLSVLKINSIRSLRVYASANNVLTWTNYSGYNPEINTTAQNNITNFGIDSGGYPVAKSFIAGIQLSF